MPLQDSAFALQDSGPISLGDVRTELGNTGIISLNDADVRTLAGRPSGVISMSNFYGAIDEIAIGGVIRDYGIYRSHTFTSSGTFTVRNALSMDILLVAAGGNGGEGGNCGGGGAGGMNVYTQTLGAGTYTATVGQPAARAYGTFTGGNTVFNGRTMFGGGKGGDSPNPDAGANIQGTPGGSGGGASLYSVGNFAAGVAGQGFAGGQGSGTNGGGGGGGAGTSGQGPSSGGPGGVPAFGGGFGLDNSYSTGSNIGYAYGGSSEYNGEQIATEQFFTPGSGGNPRFQGIPGTVVIRYVRPT